MWFSSIASSASPSLTQSNHFHFLSAATQPPLALSLCSSLCQWGSLLNETRGLGRELPRASFEFPPTMFLLACPFQNKKWIEWGGNLASVTIRLCLCRKWCHCYRDSCTTDVSYQRTLKSVSAVGIFCVVYLLLCCFVFALPSISVTTNSLRKSASKITSNGMHAHSCSYC